MDKQLYAKCLSERLMEMSMANDAALDVFNKELKPKMNNLGSATSVYWSWVNTLSEYQKKILINDGRIYKKSDFKRVRIELNKVLLEAEKEN